MKTIPPYILEWLRRELKDMYYGEIGFTLILNNGKISKIKRIHEEVHKEKTT